MFGRPSPEEGLLIREEGLEKVDLASSFSRYKHLGVAHEENKLQPENH